MLSSLNSYGGLSSAELLTLFGANSVAPSKWTSKNTAQSASTGISGSITNDPAKTIQTILAQAQIDQAQMATSSAGRTLNTAAEAAYAAQTSSTELPANGGDTNPDSSVSQPYVFPSTIKSIEGLAGDTLQQSGAPTVVTSGGDTNGESFVSQSYAFSTTTGSMAGQAWEEVHQVGNSDLTVATTSSLSVNSINSSSDVVSKAQASSLGSDPTIAAGSTQALNGTDASGSASSVANFQLSGSVAEQSPGQSSALNIELGFSVEGLGNLTTNGVSVTAHAPDAEHAWSDNIQLNIFFHGQESYVNLGIQGLDAAQAQNILTAFRKSASYDNIGPYAGPNYDPNFSISYFAATGEDFSTPTVSQQT
ncbi:MAG: hypothetical protein ACYC5H_09365 [Methylovirgula sp.]